jgi:hypothetical protein
VKQLSVVPVEWQWECVAVLDRVCQPKEVAAQVVRIERCLSRLKWTIADAVEYCCAMGLWQLTDPVVSYTRQTQRLDRLTLQQLRQLADALDGVRGKV